MTQPTPNKLRHRNERFKERYILLEYDKIAKNINYFEYTYYIRKYLGRVNNDSPSEEDSEIS
jgi:hypothetical protein